MKANQREQVRLSALRYCTAAGQWGLMEEVLFQELRNEGLRSLSPEELQAELQYLADKGLLKAAEKVISPELKRWRVTAEGRDFVAEVGGE